jgi:Flp pilus assembly pilin Flp
MKRTQAWLSNNRGQGMTEYILIVVLVAVLAIAVIGLFGNQIRSLFSTSTKHLSGDTSAKTEDFGSQSDSEVEKGIEDF